MGRVFICEKPRQGRALADVLGRAGREANGHIPTREGAVTWCFGHLFEDARPEAIWPEWAWKDVSMAALPIAPRTIPRTPRPDARAQINAIKRLLRDADHVVVASDPGREGSLIVREVLDEAGYDGGVSRLYIGSTEETDLRKALDTWRRDTTSGDRDYAAYREALARSQLDYWDGMTGTVAATLRLKPRAMGKGALQVGGVLGPLVGLIVDREEAIRTFQPQTFHDVEADVTTGDGTSLTLAHAPGVVRGEDRRLYDRDLAERIRAAAEAWAGALAVDQSADRVAPPKLYNAAGLAAKAASVLGWNGAKTLKVHQQLYEAGHLSYPRTESAQLPVSYMAPAGEILEKLARTDERFAPLARHLESGDKPVYRKGSRYVDKDLEHHAVVPTRKVPEPGKLSADERALYLLVAQNFAANHLPDAVDDKTRVHFRVQVDGRPRDFAVTGRVQREAGWRAIFGDQAEADQARLPALDNGTAARVAAARTVDRETQPPDRFREGDLQEVMHRLIDLVPDDQKPALDNPDDPTDPKGLGTAATRGATIERAFQYDYLHHRQGRGGKETKEVVPTGKAEVLVRGLRRYDGRLTEPVTRALFEGVLKPIGAAGTPGEADTRFREALAHGESQVRRLVEALHAAAPVDAGDLPPGVAFKPPVSRKAMDYAQKVARDAGVSLDETHSGWREDPAVLKGFLDTHAPKKGDPPSDRQAAAVRQKAAALGLDAETVAERLKSETRGTIGAWLDELGARLDDAPPSDKQAAAVRKVAQKEGLSEEAVGTVLASRKAAATFLDEKLGGPEKPTRKAKGGRTPTGPARRGRGAGR